MNETEKRTMNETAKTMKETAKRTMNETPKRTMTTGSIHSKKSLVIRMDVRVRDK